MFIADTDAWGRSTPRCSPDHSIVGYVPLPHHVIGSKPESTQIFNAMFEPLFEQSDSRNAGESQSASFCVFASQR
jgi:hypothetical protein